MPRPLAHAHSSDEAEAPTVREGSLLEVRPQVRNANLHTERGLSALEQSVEEDGWIGAITVAADGESFDGSARIGVATTSGYEDAIVIHSDGKRPIIHVRTDIPTAQDPRARRLGIAANRVAELDLQWDNSILAPMEAEGLLSGLFMGDELSLLLSTGVGLAGSTTDPTDTEDDDSTPRPEGQGGDDFEAALAEIPTRVRYGDVWRIGDHYLLCADSADERLVLPFLREVSVPVELPALMVTSPPYGVGKEYEEGGIEAWLHTVRSVLDTCAHVCPLWFINLANRRTGNEGYEAHTFGMLVDECEALGFPMNALRVWQKQPAWSSSAPYWTHTYKPVDDFEFLALFSDVAHPPQHKVRLDREELNEWGYRGAWTFSSVQSNALHPAAYPVELPGRAMRLLTDPQQVVYDPFAGFGTTMIAAQRLKRRARLVEISPRYCDLTLLRAEAENIGPISFTCNLLSRIEAEEGATTA